jgi:membrane protein DedA with SNARE-associated domain
LALATFVSENLTSISAGLMVAKGVINFIPATSACLAGIFVGDLLLYLAGRWLGKNFVRRAPLKWFVSEADIVRSSQWFEKRGFFLIFITRFFPGTRLATYFTAGILGVGFLRFTIYFLFAAIIWTPLLVGVSTILGGQMLEWFEVYQHFALVGLLAVVLSLLVLLKIVVPLFSRRGRRLLKGKWLRFSRWEYWPLWKFYPPIILYVAWLGIKHRSFTWFTATNPGIPMSGLVLESKHEILTALKPSGSVIPRLGLITQSTELEVKLTQLNEHLNKLDIRFPVVLKPDIGERGLGVAIIHSNDEAGKYFEKSRSDIIVQGFVDGLEYGIFYYRFPDEESGHIFSITDKRFTEITGDGKQSLEALILNNEGALAMAPFFTKKIAHRLFDIPPEGEAIKLAEIGTHSRGSTFLDGTHLVTPKLEAEIARISKAYAGSFFGRFDLKAPTVEDLKNGENIRVLELNGISSEATSIYDPKNGLSSAYRILFQQWRIASEIVSQNIENGIQPASFLQVFRQYQTYKKREKIEI